MLANHWDPKWQQYFVSVHVVLNNVNIKSKLLNPTTFKLSAWLYQNRTFHNVDELKPKCFPSFVVQEFRVFSWKHFLLFRVVLFGGFSVGFFKGGFFCLGNSSSWESIILYFSVLMLPWLRICMNLDNIVIKTFFLSTSMNHWSSSLPYRRNSALVSKAK